MGWIVQYRSREQELLDRIADLERQLELSQMSNDTKAKVLRYVLFVLKGNEEIESDLCDEVQMAADRMKSEVERLKALLEGSLTCIEAARREGAREARDAEWKWVASELARLKRVSGWKVELEASLKSHIRALGEGEESGD